MFTHAMAQTIFREKLRKLTAEAMEHPQLSPKVSALFNMQNTENAFEQFYGITDLPELPVFDGYFEEIDQYPEYLTKIIFNEFGGKTTTEKKLNDDNKYKEAFANQAALVNSANLRREKEAAEFWGNLDASSWTFMESGENKSIANTAHPTPVPNVSNAVGFNNLGTSPFSYNALNDSWYSYSRLRNSQGELRDMPDKVYLILHPTKITWRVEQVIGTDMGLDANNMNLNPAKGRFRNMAWSRLDEYSDESWGLLDIEQVLKHFYFFTRIDSEYANHIDRETLAVAQTLYLRFGLGADVNHAWRSLYWNKV